MEQNKPKLTVDINDNVTVDPTSIDIDEILTGPKQNKLPEKKLNVWIKPITKKQLIAKLIPFMLLTLFGLGLFLACMICPSFVNMDDRTRVGMYALGPILLVCFAPFCFYFFDRPYCQYNLKHNDKMKRFLAKVIVKPTSQNGCFRLRDIYLSNPNTLAWNSLNGERIIAEYAKWDFESYSKDIKYYKEHSF